MIYDITGLPDLVTPEWAREKLAYLRQLYYSEKFDQLGYAVSLKAWGKTTPPRYDTDEHNIEYIPCLPTIAEFEFYLADGVIGPYVRWVARQDALEIIASYIYGKNNPQYPPRRVYGWEEQYIREKGWTPRENCL